jgi:hypothetical protein
LSSNYCPGRRNKPAPLRKRAILVALFRRLHCPFCRREIVRLSTTQKSLTQEGVDTVAIVNTPLAGAAVLPVPADADRAAADPDVNTHHAFGLQEVQVLPDDADPTKVHWPQTTTIARLSQETTL